MGNSVQGTTYMMVGGVDRELRPKMHYSSGGEGGLTNAGGSAEEERGIEELPTRMPVSIQGNSAFRETVSHHTRPGKQFHTGKHPGEQFERERRAAHPRDGVSSGKQQSFTR